MRPLNTLEANNFINYTNYIYTRRFESQAFEDLYNGLQSFGGSADKIFDNAASGYKLIAGQLPFLQYCIAEASRQRFLSSTTDGDKENLEKLLKGFQNSIGSIYGYSRAELIESYGEYCNYCDMRIPDSSLAIEHLVPKSGFPDRMIDWSNFYLACPNCNSRKHNKPKIEILAKNEHISIKTITLHEYETCQNDLTEKYYMWPRNTASSYAAIGYSVKYVVDPQSNTSIVHRLEKFLVDVVTYIESSKNFNFSLGKVEDSGGTALYVYAIPASDANAVLVNNTIGLLGLNDDLPSNNDRLELSDRRVFNRTKVAISAAVSSSDLCKLITNISALDEQTKTSILISYMNQFADTVQYSGFFSLCIHIIDMYLDTHRIDVNIKSHLKGVIINRYRGTNLALMPLNL